MFDCVDAAPLARFWAAALGWAVALYDEDELERLAAKASTTPRTIRRSWSSPGDAELPVLYFTEVPEEKVAKNRVHLDLAADGPLEDEVQRLEALGANVRAWPEEGGSMWCVMRDPQGNEFCVVTSEDDELAEEDRAIALEDRDDRVDVGPAGDQAPAINVAVAAARTSALGPERSSPVQQVCDGDGAAGRRRAG